MKLSARLNSGYLFLISFITVFIVTPLFQKGVFGDGLMYLTVAFNRYRGEGSFWKQHYSDTSMSFFCEQPPLYFESLSWFYKLFGGAEVAAAFFTLLLLTVTVFLLVKIWNKLSGYKRKGIAWLPALLIVCVPVFTWAYCNQVIETMVTPLALLAFYFLLLLTEDKAFGKKIVSIVALVAVLTALFLTKGIQSVFLVGTLFLAAFTFKRKEFSKTVFAGILLLLTFGGVLAVIFLLSENAHFWLTSYFDKRIVGTFHNKGATATHHIDIITRFFAELLPVFGFFALVSLWVRVKKGIAISHQIKKFGNNKKALWLLLISLSASMPLAVTLEQRGFYLSPAFPFMILALCLIYKEYLFVLFARISLKRANLLRVSGYVLLVLSFVFFVWNKDGYKRDEGMIKDVQLIKEIIPRGEIIGINPSSWNTFSLHSYLNMQNNNSLWVTDTTQYFVQEKENKEAIPANYKQMELPTLCLGIYKKVNKP